ncbi:MAG: DMT family transporter [Planctomycetes bacterium]|nr:DMT family transporter [Planctomycetota bacterium]
MARASTTFFLTASALLGFAANSILCRLALGQGAIDAFSFTAIRLGSGALALFVFERASRGSRTEPSGANALSAFCLAAYAVCFSIAYLAIGAGIGALVLFGAVQATMFGWSFTTGVRPRALEWIGVAVALGGLAWLTVPGASAPDPFGLASMVLAGVAWGAYSLRGRASRFPLAATAGNFAGAAPMACAALLFGLGELHASTRGVVLAVVSGVAASGLGYCLWYRALPALGATRAGVVQLLVPILAASAALPLLGEQPNPRLVVSACAILGGVGLALVARGRR